MSPCTWLESRFCEVWRQNCVLQHFSDTLLYKQYGVIKHVHTQLSSSQPRHPSFRPIKKQHLHGQHPESKPKPLQQELITAAESFKHILKLLTFTFQWIIWFSQTSVACWGFYISTALCSSLSVHRCPAMFPKCPVFWVCFLSTYIYIYLRASQSH